MKWAILMAFKFWTSIGLIGLYLWFAFEMVHILKSLWSDI